MKNNCVFCAIVAGEIPSFRIYEDDVVISFLDINPFSYGHALVVPKVHREGLLDASDGELGDVIARVKKIASEITKRLGADGFNILQNNGEAAGQTVRHLHFHIIPRRAGEPISFDGCPGDMEKLAELAERLRIG